MVLDTQPSWVNPNDNANFPYVNSNGNSNFNWADNDQNENWRWPVVVSNFVSFPSPLGGVFFYQLSIPTAEHLPGFIKMF